MSDRKRLITLKRLGAKKIPVLLLTNSTRHNIHNAKTISVVENIHRNKMNIKYMTAACVFLVSSIGKSKAAKNDVEVIEMVNKIMFDYLKRK